MRLTHRSCGSCIPNDASVREEPIAIALSGGGTRAAAFHCGVLWALADGGLMKDVMHMCAISGGGYTAASLMTHIYQMSAEAESAPSLDAWYQRVVARTVLRMQENIGHLFFHVLPGTVFCGWHPAVEYGTALLYFKESPRT